MIFPSRKYSANFSSRIAGRPFELAERAFAWLFSEVEPVAEFSGDHARVVVVEAADGD